MSEPSADLSPRSTGLGSGHREEPQTLKNSSALVGGFRFSDFGGFT
jgi:hypothetical protein